MGTEYEFEKDENYNFESNISMNIEINKTCYSKGEIVQGNIFLLPKYGLNANQIINPYAEIRLEEKQHYQYNERKKGSEEYTIRHEEENITLFIENIPFQYNMNLILPQEGLKIPFEIKIPQTSYPSCIFNSTSYVRHFLSVHFPTIGAKKSLVIIIKNNIYFAAYNGLLKTPVVIQKEITKHKYIFFNSGSFKFSITLPKNIFSYEEIIPFIIDIESPNLSFNIRGIYVTLYRVHKLNYRSNHSQKRSSSKKELISKYISLKDLEKILHIEDNIKLPDTPEDLNPKVVYSLLDNERRNFKYKDKFKNIKLFPSCYGGLLSCEYFIEFIFDMDAWATTNETCFIPLDLYERYTGDIETPKTLKGSEINTYGNINNATQNNTYDNNINDEDELPDESEINQQKNNIGDYNKPTDDDNNQDGDAPPPSFG